MASKKIAPTHRKPKSKINRKSEWDKLSDEVEQKIFAHLMCEEGTPLTRAALQSLLVELSSVANVSVIDTVLVRQFYRRVCGLAVIAEAPERGRIFDTLADISNLLGVTSKGSHSDEVLEFVECHARFPHPDEIAKDEGHQSELSEAIASLRSKLERVERLPENEAVRFEIESEIHALENQRETDDEWPEVIAA